MNPTTNPTEKYSESALILRRYSVESTAWSRMTGKYKLTKDGTSVWVKFERKTDVQGLSFLETTRESIQRGYSEAGKPFPEEFIPTPEEKKRLEEGGRSPRSARAIQKLPAAPAETVRTNADDRGQHPREPERRVQFTNTEMERMPGWKFDAEIGPYLDYSEFGTSVDWRRPVQPRRPPGQPGDPDTHEENREEHE